MEEEEKALYKIIQRKRKACSNMTLKYCWLQLMGPLGPEASHTVRREEGKA